MFGDRERARIARWDGWDAQSALDANAQLAAWDALTEEAELASAPFWTDRYVCTWPC